MAKKFVEQGKALLSSKTFWFNALTILVAIASIFGYGDFKPDARLTEGLGIVVAIVNVVLRIRTKEPITRLK